MTLLWYLAICAFMIVITMALYIVNEVKERQKLFNILILIEVTLISIFLMLVIGIK
jgi:uncharacterized membrane protein